jgi:hypothetical protein
MTRRFREEMWLMRRDDPQRRRYSQDVGAQEPEDQARP